MVSAWLLATRHMYQGLDRRTPAGKRSPSSSLHPAGPAPALPPLPQELLKNWDELPPMLATSSKSGAGKSELLAHIAQLRELFNKGAL